MAPGDQASAQLSSKFAMEFAFCAGRATYTSLPLKNVKTSFSHA